MTTINRSVKFNPPAHPHWKICTTQSSLWVFYVEETEVVVKEAVPSSLTVPTDVPTLMEAYEKIALGYTGAALRKCQAKLVELWRDSLK